MAGPSGGEALGAYLAEQLATLRRLAPGVPDGDDEAVHQSRVAARRTRSAVRVYRRLLRREDVTHLLVELRWLGQRLGPVRDLEVMSERLAEQIGELPRPLRRGPVASRVAASLLARREGSLRAMNRGLAARHEAVIRELESLVTDLPTRGRSRRPAVETMPRLLAHAHQRVRAARVVVRTAPHADDVDHQWHEVRKQAKSARYAAEVLGPVVGEPAEQLAAAWQEVTSALGDLQDSLSARELIRSVATEADGAGEPSFSYGVLHEAERQAAVNAIREGDAAISRALLVDPRTWEQ